MYSVEEVKKKLGLEGGKSNEALNQLMIMSGVHFQWQGKSKGVPLEDLTKMKNNLNNYIKEVDTRYWKLALCHGQVKVAFNLMDEFQVSRYKLMKTAKSLNIPTIHEGKVILFKNSDYLRLKNHLFPGQQEEEKKEKESFLNYGTVNTKYHQYEATELFKETKEKPKDEIRQKNDQNFIAELKTKASRLENEVEAQIEIIKDKNFLLEKNRERIDYLELENQDLTRKVERLMSDLKGLSKLRNAISTFVNEGFKKTSHPTQKMDDFFD